MRSVAPALAIFSLAACSPSKQPLRYETSDQQARIYAGDELLAVYDRTSNTFTEFRVEGMNVLGGFAPGTSATNGGPAQAGHPAPYPFGNRAGDGTYPHWEGFWSGFSYYDINANGWLGVNGNPGAVESFEVSSAGDDAVDLHVVSTVKNGATPYFHCDVRYRVSREGIAVRDDVLVQHTLYPAGEGDTGGQLLMTQADSDIDPALPLDTSQPSQYFQMAFDEWVQPIDPYNPSNNATPSNMYDDTSNATPGAVQHQLPGTALVPGGKAVTYTSTLGRRDRAWNVALRVDLAHSTLPQLEYYCEVNGLRDYLNFVYSPAVGLNRSATTIPTNTHWVLYGELRPWKGSDPSALGTALPLLSDPLLPAP